MDDAGSKDVAVENKPELLAPAGDMEKLKYAFAYGADAAYLGGQAFGLRAYAGNFNDAELAEAIAYAHGLGKKIYVTVNIFAHEDDFRELPAYLRRLAEIGADAALVSDPGVIALAREVAPALPLHLSTQANNTNSYTVNFWLGQGAERVVLARELTLEELKAVRVKVDGELEMFVHGAMCMSYSGRCLLSNYLTGRDANRGECTQPCRWGYALTEEKRPGEYFPVEEDRRGTYIFNSHDLCLLPYMPLLKPIGIGSWKIEGRMKSVHYVACTIKVYREAIDTLWDEGEEAFQARLPEWLAEMDKVSHRDYSPGFLFGKPGAKGHNIETSHYVREYDFVGIGLSEGDGVRLKKMDSDQIDIAGEGPLGELNPAEAGTGEFSEINANAGAGSSQTGLTGLTAVVEQRNHFRVGDVLEVLSPKERPWSFPVGFILDQDGRSIEAACHAQQIVRIPVPRPLPPYAILRRAKPERIDR